MGRRSFPGGIITSTELAVTGYGASGMWTTQTAAQKKNSGLWPIPGITPSGPLVGPTIANVAVTDSSYNVINDTPYINSAGGYIKVSGTGFASGATVYVGGSAAVTTSFVNSTEVRAQVAAGATSNAFPVYVVNTDSSVAIKLAAVTYSGSPSWSTSSTLAAQATDIAFSIALSATGDSAITYSLAAGSSLPPGTALSSGGVFSGTVTGASITVDTTYSFDVVANDAENQDSSRTFTVNVSIGDQYFYLTPLLLNGDTGNTWVTDSSTNKFNITISGDSRPVAFSPYNTYWSTYIGGSTDYITAPASTDYNFGTGDFTIECWTYPLAYSTQAGETYYPIATTHQYFGSGTTVNWAFRWSSTGGPAMTLAGYDAGSNASIQSSAYTLPLHTWTHLAAVRISGVVTFYVNGVSYGGGSYTRNMSTTQALDIGTLWGGTAFSVQWTSTGYFNNLRIVKGLGVYTGAFTVPTSPLTVTQSSGTNISAITEGQTVFLGCQANRFLDANTTPKAVTVGAGTPQTRSFAPFVETDTVTGSAYFDGTGDFITTPSSSAFALSGDFTVEFWVYFLGNPYGGGASREYIQSTVNGGFAFLITGTLLKVSRTGTGDDLTVSYTTVVGQWYHFAISRTSGTMGIYANGNLVGSTGSVSVSYTTGAMQTTSGNGGYMSNWRVVNGTGLYTANFTPATSSLTSVTNTQLLLLQYRVGENNHRFVDESGVKTVITRGGNASQGSFSPFSPAGWSASFDGNGDYLSIAHNTAFNLATGDFTLEAWVWWDGVNASGCIIDKDGVSGSSYPSYSFSLATSRLTIYLGSGNGTSSLQNFSAPSNFPIGQWVHVAAVKSGSVITLFQNGANVAAATQTATITDGGKAVLIGYATGQPTAAYWSGYISNARIVKGVAVYTGNFTPQTSSLSSTQSSSTNVAAITGTSTSLLTLQNNQFIDNSTNAFAITRNGDAKIQAFSPFRNSGQYIPTTHGGSVYFGTGSTDFLTVPASGNFAYGTRDFTIEGWIYAGPAASLGSVIWSQSVSGTNYFIVTLGTDNKIYFTGTLSGGGTGIGSAEAINLYSWNHFAVVRTSGVIRVYLNGLGGTATSNTVDYTNTSYVPTMARYTHGGTNVSFTGFISNFRIVKSQALFSANFTVPTTVPTFNSNTVFQTNFTHAGIYDITGRVNFETVGDAKISNVASKFGLGSLYFDGTGDYLTTPDSALYNFGSGDFTIEFWTYITTYTSDFKFVIKASSVSNYWQFAFNNGGTIGPNFNYNNNAAGQVIVAQQGNTTGWATNTWYHVALVRNGTAVNIYKDGSSVASGTLSGALVNPSAAVVIGGSAVSTSPLNGYLDDFRITRFARYTANFTAPTSTFQTK